MSKTVATIVAASMAGLLLTLQAGTSSAGLTIAQVEKKEATPAVNSQDETKPGQETTVEKKPTAEVAPETAPAAKMTVEEELQARPDLGPRTLQDLSEEARKIRRKQMMETGIRVMPPVPPEVKKTMFDNMAASSPMSMRDMFNFMAFKVKVKKGMSFDEVLESMEIKANEVNFKKVGHNKFWRDVGAITGLPTSRVEIVQYCDAMVGRRMLDYSPEFVIFIPCRIAVYEDANGDIWLMTMDWDVSWLAKAWHPDSKLGDQMKQDAARIRDALKQIMEAGAKGEW